MADSDKDIVITPNTGAASDPSIVFSSGATGGDDVTLNVTDDGTITTLSIEGSAGQLLAITNDLTGTIFAVNDVSGIPSIEVDADGTIRLAEFDGDVGIGQGTPTHKLHITGPTTANTNTGIFVDSTGDAYLDLRADNTTGGAETNNPYVRFRQDQDVVECVIGFNDNANDALGNAVTGAGSNEFVIHNRFATGTTSLAVNGSVGLTVDDNDRVYIGQDTVGYFEAVTGNYGSVQVAGAEGSSGTWQGYSIGARHVFMDNGSTSVGIYNDTDNEWMIQAVDNAQVGIYHNGVETIRSSDSGIFIADPTNDPYIAFYSSGFGTRQGYIQSFDSTSGGAMEMRNEVVSGNVQIFATDSGSTVRTILNANPNASTILRGDTDLDLEVSAGSQAILCTGGGDVSLYHNNGLEFRTQQHELTGNTSGAEMYDHSGTLRDVGFNNVRSISQTSSTINPLDDTHCGSIILRTGTSNVSILMATGSTFPTGSMCTILNNGTGGTHTISANTTTMYVMDGSGSVSTPASFALAIGGCITVWRQNTTVYYVWGAGIP